MRFQIDCHKLGTFVLAACAIPAWLFNASSHAVGQERTVSQAIAGPGQQKVTPASSVRPGESPSARTARVTGVVMLVQPPNDPSPLRQIPAAQGPASLAAPPAGNKGNNIAPNSTTLNPDVAGDEFNENSLMPLQNRGLNNRVQVVDLSVAGLGTGQIPEGPAAELEVEAAYGRAATFKCVYWQPSNICHYPLRFEEAMLERHGHVRFGYLQPLASGARFFATIPMIPYLNTLQPRCESVYALGNYRPGSCAPLVRDTVPYDAHAAVVEAMAVAGFFWAAPL